MSTAEKVLVTGANGYLSSHIIHLLVEQGFKIVGTVRSQEKGTYFLQKYPDADLHFEVVKEKGSESSYQQVFERHPDIKYILHMASAVFFNGSNPEKDIIQPAVNTTLALLKAATNTNVSKVVVTSSFACLMQSPSRLTDPSMEYNETLWNPITLEQAGQSVQNSYFASKVFAEKAAWQYLHTKLPQFTITTVQTPLTLGPPINEIGYESISSSSEFLLKLITKPAETITQWESSRKSSIASTEKDTPFYKVQETDIFPFYIDVRDAALIHVRAMLEPSLDNKRCLSVGGTADSFCMIESLCRVCPEYLEYLSPELRELVLNDTSLHGKRTQDFVTSQYAKCDTSECRKHLKVEFRPLDVSVYDTVKRVEELEKAYRFK